MKYTQHDLIVIALAEKESWCNSYIFKGLSVKVGKETHFIGSEADCRLYELFDKNVTDKNFKSVDWELPDHSVYTVETKKDGNRRMYRAFLKRPTMKQAIEYLQNGEVRVSYVPVDKTIAE